MTANDRSIKMEASWLDDGQELLLEHATLNDELGRPFEYQLDMLSKTKDLDVRKAMWGGITISVDEPATVDHPSGGTRYFNGYVTRFSRGEFVGDYTRYKATLRPWTWLLTRISDCRVFQNKSALDIVKEVCTDLRFEDIDDSQLKHKPYRTLDFVVQYRETTFNFISRLMEQEGIYYFFQHTKEGRHIMVLADAHDSHAVVDGYKKITYQPPEALQQGSRGEEEHINRWQVSRQVEALNFTLDDFNFETPRAPMISNKPVDPADEDSGPAFELYDYPGLYKVGDPEGNKVVQVMMEERRARVESASGSGNARGLTTGALFNFANYSVEDQNKEYLLVSTSIVLSPNVFHSGSDTAGPEFHCNFVAMDSKRQFRTPRKTPKPTVQGPQTAIVVGEQGQDITTDPDGYGRVKIQFHWDRISTNYNDSSCWVRVAQLWAGQGWGAMHIPRIGQEVIVEFLEGDPDRPIITGRVYNKDNMPPYKLPDNKTQSGIKSRSTLGGGPSNFNEIRFEDKKGSEELHFQAEKDQSSLVKHNRSATVNANDSVSVGGDRSVHVTGNLSVTVDGKGSSPNQADWNVTGKYHVKASETIVMEAPNSITLVVGQTSIKIEPKKITLQVDGGASITMDPNINSVSSNGGSVLINDNINGKAKGKAELLLSADVFATSADGAGCLLLSGQDALLRSDGKTTVNGKQTAYVAGDGGNATVTADASGVAVQGKQVNLNS
ncbi:MAG TPA: type VI secretion system tip protein TssI/VgrG [Polyangia bacterium]|nr:type VI secretion system tip protein TssI/VgrG [Polyangia bacterium]